MMKKATAAKNILFTSAEKFLSYFYSLALNNHIRTFGHLSPHDTLYRPVMSDILDGIKIPSEQLNSTHNLVKNPDIMPSESDCARCKRPAYQV